MPDRQGNIMGGVASWLLAAYAIGRYLKFFKTDARPSDIMIAIALDLIFLLNYKLDSIAAYKGSLLPGNFILELVVFSIVVNLVNSDFRDLLK